MFVVVYVDSIDALSGLGCTSDRYTHFFALVLHLACSMHDICQFAVAFYYVCVCMQSVICNIAAYQLAVPSLVCLYMQVYAALVVGIDSILYAAPCKIV